MKKALKYQISDVKLVLIIYFAVVLLALCIGSASIVNINVKMTGMSSFGLSGAVVCFILGIAIFREHFFVLMQNGICRDNFFKSSLCTFAILSFVYALLEAVVMFILESVPFFHSGIHLVSTMQMVFPAYFEGLNSASAFLLNSVLTFVITIFLFTFGFFIAGIAYIFPKNMRAPFFVGAMIVFFAGLPTLYNFFPAPFLAVLDILIRIMGIKSGNPLMMIGFFFVLFLIFISAVRVLIKRAEIS